MKKQASADFETGSHVLSRLFAAQSVLHIFPNAAKMGEFAAQAIKDIPDVRQCSFCLYGSEKPLGDTFDASSGLLKAMAGAKNNPSFLVPLPVAKNLLSFPLRTVDHSFGYLLLLVTEDFDIGFYESVVGNFVNMLAIYLENLEYRAQVKSQQDELQSKIDERTEELRAEIDRCRLFERSLQVQKNEFEAIFELVPAQIWYKDIHNRFLRVNRQVCNDIGLTKEEIEGHSAEELFPDFAKQFFDDDLEVFKSRRPKLGISEQINASSGDIRWLHTDKIPVFGDNGEVNGLIAFVNDITERKLNEEGIIKAKEKAEESDRLKSALLNNMSHEIRTPMNAIMGFSDLMAEADGDMKNQYAAIIRQSSNQLLTLIDDMIQLSRLQSEKMPLNKVKFYPANLVAEVSGMFNLPEVRKEIEIVLNIPDRYKELVILSDADKVRQVLTNFVSNALKYTSKGSVEIGFDLKENNIEFYVKDTGIGIPDQEQDRIFESFYRGKQALSSAIRGTGLGLSITKELVDLMGGRVGVSSEQNKGSRFYFSIPYIASEMEKTGEQPAGNTISTPDRALLIVDDEFINYQYLEILLRNSVKRVDHAANGKVAVDMVHKNRYNLILMDMKMPVMSGIEATKILKKQFPELPIIAQTAFSLPEEKASALQAGCDDFLSKPIKKEELLEVISKYIR